MSAVRVLALRVSLAMAMMQALESLRTSYAVAICWNFSCAPASWEEDGNKTNRFKKPPTP
eukprot:1461474-Amphidinium_carterae.1